MLKGRLARRLALAAVAVAFSGSAASATDYLPAAPPPPPPAYWPITLYDWTGLYAGFHAGVGWADKHFVQSGDDLGGHTADGTLAGAQIGYNLQAGTWVYGIEAQFSAANLDGSHVDQYQSRQSTDVDSLTTLAARFGRAWDRHLLYVKGGFAWVDEDFDDFATDIGQLWATAHGQERTGWMFGIGWEYGFAPAWSAKIEYDYMDFGTETVSYVPAAAPKPFTNEIDQDVSLIKFGINYRFGAGP